MANFMMTVLWILLVMLSVTLVVTMTSVLVTLCKAAVENMKDLFGDGENDA